MDDEEIIAARHEYERQLWLIFGRTLLVMPDMHQARLAYNEQVKPVYEALPPEVACTLKEWQRR